MSTVLITGGAGFIGARLAAVLTRAGHRVSVFDALHPLAHPTPEATVAALSAGGIAFGKGDIRDAGEIAAALDRSQAEIVIHLAAETGTGQSHDLPVQYCDTNVTGTARLVEAIRAGSAPVRRVLLAGSRAVYGEGRCLDAQGVPTAAVPRRDAEMRAGRFDPQDREGRPLVPAPTGSTWPAAPTSIYASTKLMQEHVLRQGFDGTPVAVGILRLQNVYGPGQSLANPYTGVLSIFARALLEGATLNIYEDGRITRDFVFVDDVVAAFAALAVAEQCPDEILDIGTGAGVTILDVAHRMSRLLGLGPERVTISGDFRPGDIRHAVADIGRARAVLGWQPTVGIDTGLSALLDWSRETMGHDLQASDA